MGVVRLLVVVLVPQEVVPLRVVLQAVALVDWHLLVHGRHWLPKIYGKDLKNDKLGLGHDQKAIGEFGSGDFSNGFKALEDGTLGKIAKGIKKLF